MWERKIADRTGTRLESRRLDMPTPACSMTAAAHRRASPPQRHPGMGRRRPCERGETYLLACPPAALGTTAAGITPFGRPCPSPCPPMSGWNNLMPSWPTAWRWCCWHPTSPWTAQKTGSSGNTSGSRIDRLASMSRLTVAPELIRLFSGKIVRFLAAMRPDLCA